MPDKALWLRVAGHLFLLTSSSVLCESCWESVQGACRLGRMTLAASHTTFPGPPPEFCGTCKQIPGHFSVAQGKSKASTHSLTHGAHRRLRLGDASALGCAHESPLIVQTVGCLGSCVPAQTATRPKWMRTAQACQECTLTGVGAVCCCPMVVESPMPRGVMKSNCSSSRAGSVS